MFIRSMRFAGIVALLACGCGAGGLSRQGAKVLTCSEKTWAVVGSYGVRGLKRLGIMAVADQAVQPVLDELVSPEGKPDHFVSLAYNKPEDTLICADEIESVSCSDVWWYRVRTGQRQWIAKGRWTRTMGFAWSPDGTRVAFVGRIRGRREGELLQYDLRTNKLELLANDAFGCDDDSPAQGDELRIRRPAYSGDGARLYYVSQDRRVAYYDMATKRSRQLPFGNCIAVFSINGGDIVYARELPKPYRFEIVRANLKSVDDAVLRRLYVADGELHLNCPSPSGRFILFEVCEGYYVDKKMIDVVTGKAYSTWGLGEKAGFRIDGPAFMGSGDQ
jgi:Tol biopolymer transport system component